MAPRTAKIGRADQRVFDFLKAQRSPANGWVDMDADKVARLGNFTLAQVRQALWLLGKAGLVEVDRWGGEHSRIKDIRVLDRQATVPATVTFDARTYRPRRSGPVERIRPTVVLEMPDAMPGLKTLRTPLIDAYEAGKEEFLALKNDPKLGAFIVADYPLADPLSEEAIKVKARAVRLETELIDTRRELEAANRDLGYFRKTRDGQFRQALASAGVMSPLSAVA